MPLSDDSARLIIMQMKLVSSQGNVKNPVLFTQRSCRWISPVVFPSVAPFCRGPPQQRKLHERFGNCYAFLPQTRIFRTKDHRCRNDSLCALHHGSLGRIYMPSQSARCIYQNSSAKQVKVDRFYQLLAKIGCKMWTLTLYILSVSNGYQCANGIFYK